jgi:hypothetical protein
MTLFKIPRAEDQDKLLEMYKAMPEKALKVRPVPSLDGLQQETSRYEVLQKCYSIPH